MLSLEYLSNGMKLVRESLPDSGLGIELCPWIAHVVAVFPAKRQLANNHCPLPPAESPDNPPRLA